MGLLRIQTDWSGSATGLPYLSMMSFITPDPTTQANVDAAVAAVGTFWNSVKAQVANNFAYQVSNQVDEIDLDGTLTDVWAAATSPNGTGVQTDPYLPTANQCMIRWTGTSVVAGRVLKGRTFVPGLTEAQVDDGVLLAFYLTVIQNAANALIADAASVLAVWSKTHLTVTTVASALVPAKVAILRSRRD